MDAHERAHERERIDVTLLDDGTADTVVEVSVGAGDRVRVSRGLRYSDTAAYRDPETGTLDETAFFQQVREDVEADPSFWEATDEARRCPKCDAPGEDLEEVSGVGFAGGTIYFTKCRNCGNVCDVDESEDVAAAR